MLKLRNLHLTYHTIPGGGGPVALQLEHLQHLPPAEQDHDGGHHGGQLPKLLHLPDRFGHFVLHHGHLTATAGHHLAFFLLGFVELVLIWVRNQSLSDKRRMSSTDGPPILFCSVLFCDESDESD